MLHALDQFYENLPEPNRSCFIALRDIILDFHVGLTPEWKYKLPFFYYKKKMFCYLWKDKKTNEPYIGFSSGYKMNHPALEQGDRKRMKILRVNPNEDIDIDTIRQCLQLAIEVHE